MESIIFKITKYLVRGKSYDAFHGVLLASYLILIIFISGCSWFADNRVVVKPKFDITSPKHRETLRKIINKSYDNEYLKIIAADREYQKYLKSKNGQGKSIRKDGYALVRRH